MAKKITYKVESDVADDFEVGDCYSCPFNRVDYVEYDDDGYSELDRFESCDLGMISETCGLVLEETNISDIEELNNQIEIPRDMDITNLNPRIVICKSNYNTPSCSSA